MEETIELKEYFSVIKKRMSMIIAITIATGLVAAVFGILSKEKIAPVEQEKRTYEAVSSIKVSYDIQKAEETIFKNEEDKDVVDMINRNLDYNKSLLSTYAQMLASNKTIEKVAKNLHIKESVSEVKSNVTIEPIGESQLLSIKVKSSEPKVAMNIANEIPKVFDDKDLTIEVVDKAIEPTKPMPKLDESGNPVEEEALAQPVKPNKIKKVITNTVIGLVLGATISLFVVFSIKYMDNKVRTEQQIQRELELPILGVVPNINPKGGKKNDDI